MRLDHVRLHTRPELEITRRAASVVLGSVVIAAMAQIAIPVGPVPVSAQTLGVFLVALALGPRLGATAVLLYLGQGLVGLPVFAGGTAGPAVLLGPTGGYLIGFVPAAWIVGQISQRRLSTDIGMTAGILVAATAVTYAFGASWLSRFVGMESVFTVGVLPFLPGDLLKLGIAAMAAPMMRMTK